MVNNLPVKSSSKGIQKAHVRRVHTRRGPKDVMVNPSVHKHVPVKVEKQVVKRESMPVSPTKQLVPKLRWDVVEADKADKELLASEYNNYINHAPADMIIGAVQGGIFGTGIATLPACPLCGAGSVGNMILVTKRIDKPFNARPVVAAACEDCYKDYLRKGIMILGMDDKNNFAGRVVVIKEDYFKRVSANLSNLDTILKGRVMLMPSDEWERQFGKATMPVSEPKDLKQIMQDLKDNNAVSEDAMNNLKKSLKDAGLWKDEYE